jgi:hypothetical protein
MSPCLGEQEMLAADQVFYQFPLKIWNANLHESCVPQQTGQLSYWEIFEVFRWNLENAAKVLEDIHLRQCLSGVWPCLWPRVDLKGVLTWSRGSIGFVGEVFEVMTQVNHGLTNVSRFDSADSAISVNDAN